MNPLLDKAEEKQPAAAAAAAAVAVSAAPAQSGGYNPMSFPKIRENWIRKEMEKRKAEYTTVQQLSVFCGTWNVNAKKPSEDLSSWLVVSPLPDIYMIGFQEIVDLNAVNLVADHTASKIWEKRIEETLKQQYKLVASQHLVGLALLVYVKKELQDKISGVRDDTVGVGIMGVGGNKGAVAVRFNVFDSSVVCVNAHLAAHKNNVQGRNSDYHNVCKRLRFADPSVSSADFVGAPGEQPYGELTLFDHDNVFWIGDLNYRLNLTDLESVYSRIDVQDWAYLLQHDQLILEKAEGHAFDRFLEGPIDFAPTYKYQPGTNLYDRRPEKKMRFPAWCDRVQWIGDGIKQQWYRRTEQLLISDHKPVSAYFTVDANITIADKQKDVYESCVRQLDQWENEAIPRVSMSRNEINFSNCSFDNPITETLRIENTGQVVVKYHFIPKLKEEHFCKPWLQVSPEFGLIMPNETHEISLTVHITKQTAQKLNTGDDSLQDILIFRLENGRDYFITISGDYLKSCFGSTIDYLVKTPMPVRFAQNAAATPAGKVLSVPKEMWRMVDYLFRKGLDEEGLFITSGNAKQIELIRECVDTGQKFANFDIHSMAETLTQFLQNLAEPIFSRSLCEQFHESMNLTAWCKQALMHLPPAHYNAFIYMVCFLREVLKRSDKNQLTVDQLVLIFSSCLMHVDLEGHLLETSGHSKPKAWVILRHFLTSDEFI